MIGDGWHPAADAICLSIKFEKQIVPVYDLVKLDVFELHPLGSPLTIKYLFNFFVFLCNNKHKKNSSIKSNRVIAE